MPPIFLIGYMCSGKTTLGRAVSVYTGLRFIDLDEAIEQRVGLSVSQIFAQRGEEEFRSLEADVLAQLACEQDVIIACGGGTPCRDGAMALMNSQGLTIRLMADTDTLVDRLMAGRANRPLIRHIDNADDMRAFIVEALAKRQPYYDKAQYVFDSSQLDTPEQIEQSVRRFADLYITPTHSPMG